MTENVDSDGKHKHSNKRKNIICLNEKKIDENIILYLTGLGPVTSCFLLCNVILVYLTRPLGYFGPVINRYTVH